MNRKRLLGLLACAAVLVIGTVGATMAYFTDTEKATNTFTVGKVGITLDETDVDDSTPDKDRDTANEYKLIPGSTYVKDPTVLVDKDSDECWLFVTVNADNRITSIEEEGKSIAEQMKANGWIKLENITHEGVQVYAYEDKVKAEDEKVVFRSITIDGDKANNDEMDAIQESLTQIIVKAYAIQAAGFDTAKDAWTTVDGKF